MKKTIKRFLPWPVTIYHKIRKTLYSFIKLPAYIWIEETSVMLPAHNWMVYAIYSGGGTLRDRRLYYEEEMVDIFKKLLTKESVFFDVGAGMGYYSYIAASQGAEIFAFEPNNALAKFIRQCMKKNHLSAQVHTTPLGIDNKQVISDIGLQKTYKKSTSLDSFVAEQNAIPTALKIDVDGNEVEILLGAENTLRNNNIQLLLEIRPETEWLVGKLGEWGYVEKRRFGGEDNSMILFSKE